MRLKRIVAPTMQEALEKTRRELGPDAVILNARTIRAGGFFGLFGSPKVEVTAALDVDTAVSVAAVETARVPEGRISEREPRLEAIYRELREMRRDVAALIDGTRSQSGGAVFGGALLAAFRRLVDNDIEEETARILVEEVATDLGSEDCMDLEKVHAMLVDRLVRLIPVAEEITFDSDGPKVIAMVGPTGVGKTTTIAKLAAAHALTHRRKVALITADTYRIAAIEQLRTYSDIIGIPLEVVYSPEEIRPAIESHSDADVILMDTAGRNPRNPARMLELRGIIRAARPDEVHLVISATTKNSDALDVVDRFEQVGFDRLLFTKLDESSTYGMILNTLVRAQRPLSYLGTGQDVPEDFEIASAAKLAHMIMGDWGIAPGSGARENGANSEDR
ncbi:MAG: flagellar biosynthesis protein FlhF [Firmicutes bacterium]|nr:flagellar biosynthesis protein FlhF [Bacillota bacterium]